MAKQPKQEAAWRLYREYQVGSKLLAEIVRSGVARGLYSPELGERALIELGDKLEDQLRREVQEA